LLSHKNLSGLNSGWVFLFASIITPVERKNRLGFNFGRIFSWFYWITKPYWFCFLVKVFLYWITKPRWVLLSGRFSQLTSMMTFTRRKTGLSGNPERIFGLDRGLTFTG